MTKIRAPGLGAAPGSWLVKPCARILRAKPHPVLDCQTLAATAVRLLEKIPAPSGSRTLPWLSSQQNGPNPRGDTHESGKDLTRGRVDKLRVCRSGPAAAQLH